MRLHAGLGKSYLLQPYKCGVETLSTKSYLRLHVVFDAVRKKPRQTQYDAFKAIPGDAKLMLQVGHLLLQENKWSHVKDQLQ